jgi:hemolysin III
MTLKVYSPAEERINISSHALGLALSIVALLLLVLRARSYDNALYTLSFSVFGASLICLYLASTLYHSAKTQRLRTRLRIVDHATIYILIAGTYTPFCLITLSGPTGWAVFAVSWGLAAAGLVLKLFFTGRFQLLSTLMYVFMGWIVIFVVKPMIANLPLEGLVWLIVGGISYTTGAVIYSIKKIPFNHAIFHLFVLAGSFCHFIAVYQYVYPS